MIDTSNAPLTRALLGSWLLVQLALLLASPPFQTFIFAWFGLMPARLLAAWHGQAELLPALFTLISHQFLHGGWLHLGLNALFFIDVGPPVEKALGGSRLALLFLASGVAGGLTETLLDPASMTPVVGASGAISGVFAAFALLYGRQQVAPRRLLGVELSGGLLNALWLAASWFGLQWLTQLAFNSGGPHVAIWSHIGGFIAGLALAPALSSRRG